MFQLLRPSSWDEARRLVEKLPGSLWAFRGHREASWRLETTLERSVRIHWLRQRRKRVIEKEILWRFESGAHQYLSHPPSSDQRLDWLALLQHYGGPTRLLDFTFSFYIAVFFAIEDARGDAVVWVIDLDPIEDAAREKAKEGSSFEHDIMIRLRHIKMVEDCLAKEEDSETPMVLSVVPRRMNERLFVQQGLFLFPFRLEYSFQANLERTLGINSGELDRQENAMTTGQGKSAEIDDRATAIKLILPKEQHDKIWQDLKDMNITAASLFPGLEGFARSMHTRLRS